MKIEFSFNSLQEFSLGIFTAYGEDDSGSFAMLNFGFLFFDISIFKYI